MGSGNNEVEDVEPSNASSGSKRKRETSFVWNYMTRVDVNGIWMAKCDFCEKLLNATQGISSLRKHVLGCLGDHQEATNSTNPHYKKKWLIVTHFCVKIFKCITVGIILW